VIPAGSVQNFDALVPSPRQSQPRTPPEVRMFIWTGLTAPATPEQAPVFGRFEASRPNEIWTGDALHAIRLAGTLAE
jgi:putative transposase